MNHEDAFLDAIRHEPDDDAHRLIFADWLEDRGDPRGPFIRCQVLAEQKPLRDPARLALEEEARDHFEANRTEWLLPLAGHADGWTFRRGFVETVSLSKDAFLDLPSVLFDRHPVREAHLVLEPLDRSPQDLADLAACPHLQFIERLGLVHRFLADSPVESLLASPHLGRLRGLVLSGTYLTGRWLGEIDRYPVLAQIEELDLSHCPFLHDRVLRTLAGSRQIGVLRKLHLGATALTPYGLIALLAPHRLARLVDLQVTVMNVPALAEASRRALRELASSPTVEQLTSLSLRGGSLAGERAERLFSSPLENVRDLQVIGCELSGPGASALAAAPSLRRLTRLNLAHNKLDPEDMGVLANSPILERVEILELADNLLQGRGLTVLAHSRVLGRLAHLDLARNRVGGPSVQALAHAPLAAGLRRLNLSENYVGQVGVEGLASSPSLTGLTHLDLSLNRLEPASAAALARSPNFGHVTVLNLSSNQLGDAGAAALAGSPHLGRLRKLDLRHNQIGRGGVEALLASTTLPRLDELDLRGNELCSDEKPRLAARFGGAVSV
jgi:uncharacterized protein (TIGR02996 family)